MKNSNIFNVALGIAVIEIICLLVLVGNTGMNTVAQLSVVAVAISGFVALVARISSGHHNHIPADDAALVFESYR